MVPVMYVTVTFLSENTAVWHFPIQSTLSPALFGHGRVSKKEMFMLSSSCLALSRFKVHLKIPNRKLVGSYTKQLSRVFSGLKEGSHFVKLLPGNNSQIHSGTSFPSGLHFLGQIDTRRRRSELVRPHCEFVQRRRELSFSKLVLTILYKFQSQIHLQWRMKQSSIVCSYFRRTEKT